MLRSLLLKFCNFLLVAADGAYVTRPDLAPPRLNITIPASAHAEKGYIFIAPFSGFADTTNHGPLQAAPYILTHTGDLVWSGFTYFSIWAANFQATRWKGQDVLFSFEGAHNGPHGHGHGHHTILNRNYQNIRELRAGNHLLSDKHEFIILNETTALIQIYHPLQIDLEEYGGVPSQSWIVDARFQELDIESGDVLFEWHSLDHISPHETKLPLTEGLAGLGHNSSTAWDYFHINSITKNDEGHYLLSARHASTIYKINGTDGSIIWRLGGPKSDFKLGPNVTFGFQHHARWLAGSNDTVDLISLFDNSVYGSESAGGGQHEVRLYPFSRGKYIALDHARKTATLERAFHPPGKAILARSQGSLQALPNGNALVNWGSEGQVTEYDARGAPVFHAFLDSGALGENVQNYRAFLYNWTGISPETPAVAARAGADGGTSLWASWNGDTRTAAWVFSWVEAGVWGGEVVRSREVRRTGFETRLDVRTSGRVLRVRAEAVDSTGRSLAKSASIAVDRVNSKGLVVPNFPRWSHEKESQVVLGDVSEL